jgi:HSP20 family protein
MFGLTTGLERDPMLELLHPFDRRMGRVFLEPFTLVDWDTPVEAEAAWMPVVDVVEEPEQIRLVAEIPGVKPEDIEITVEGDLLAIKGTKEQVPREKGHRYERAYGAFERAFTLPAAVAPEKIKATYDHGTLTVMLPKAEMAKAHLIKVEVMPDKVPGLTR